VEVVRGCVQEADVDATLGHAAEEGPEVSVVLARGLEAREDEGLVVDEGHADPHPGLGVPDRRSDAGERRYAVHQRPSVCAHAAHDKINIFISF
jgi:hypothetical protein